MPIYNSLLGYKCQTESDRVIEYPLGLLDLFTDHIITFEQMKYPIILNDCSNNVYDKDSLIKWLYKSNKDPATGVEMKKLIKFTPFINFFVSMILLEKQNDKLLFHVPNIDLINLFRLIKYTVDSNNNKTNEKENYDHSSSNVNTDPQLIQLDIKYYLKSFETKKDFQIYSSYYDITNLEITDEDIKILKDGEHEVYNCVGNKYSKTAFEPYYDFNLQDILINDVVTGLRIKDPIMNSNNVLLDKNTEDKNQNGYTCSTLEEFLSSRHDYDCKIIYNNILDVFVKNKVDLTEKPKNYQDHMKDNMCSFYDIFKNTNPSLKLRYGDFYISSNSTMEYMYAEYIKFMESDLVKSDDYNKKKELISKYIKSDTNLLVKATYGGDYGPLEKFRKDINFPILSFTGVYSDDFSLLDLNNAVFNNDKKNPAGGLKGRDFIGTNLSGSTFKNIDFSACSFIACNLINTSFIDCVFRECAFYKNIVNDETDISSSKFDKMSSERWIADTN